jgi:F-type H+-transporting ATPase subunit b
MPQFDPSTYASQLFWLIITFGLLVVFMRAFFMPRLMKILDARDQFVRSHKEEAQKLLEQTRELEQKIEQKLKNSQDYVRHLIESTVKEQENSRERLLESINHESTENVKELMSMIARQRENSLETFGPLIERTVNEAIANIQTNISAPPPKKSKPRAV